MFTQLEQAKEKWGGTSDVIDRWLATRQQVLVSYCKLATHAPNGRSPLPEAAQLENFCAILLDYVSAGHFEIFEQVVSRCEKRGDESLALANRVYPKITDTTQFILDFNDKYQDLEDEDRLLELDGDLSSLGEVLEQRFELEDKLIATLHQHQSQPA
ncbi:Rsd/AlgQ family anti-sigma factor [Gallaecimonas xiamenensis]|uniref:Anti-RNA polymerase sigma 70 factor n=1 Tax=Gallaecimonas xiamenensis 3-C-1 TaxID=745411 RepID=K2J2L5_9GAMM|nr:Rsd/AlgQ family anti-sigma factor [Gallaecimonas xiamenensis]EKE77181.1 anti-RNA polymerase sigma 70 factor [Gallaecimonas xiamenensis 3-C-1]